MARYLGRDERLARGTRNRLAFRLHRLDQAVARLERAAGRGQRLDSLRPELDAAVFDLFGLPKPQRAWVLG